MFTLDNRSLNDVIAGKTISNDKQIEKLITPPSDIAPAVQKISEEVYPRPMERLFNIEIWKQSVFNNLPRNDIDVARYSQHRALFNIDKFYD